MNLWRRIKQLQAEEKELELMMENTLGKKQFEQALISKANAIRDFWNTFCLLSVFATTAVSIVATDPELIEKGFSASRWYLIFIIVTSAVLLCLQVFSYKYENVVTVQLSIVCHLLFLFATLVQIKPAQTESETENINLQLESLPFSLLATFCSCMHLHLFR